LPFLLWLTHRFFPGTEGSGIPQVIAETNRPGDLAWRPLLSLRIAIGKVFLGVSAVGAGFSFGREGPTVQIGACLMAAIGRFLPPALQVRPRHLMVAGGAAGIAAAFNAPLAGIVFAIEELSRSIESRMSGVVITAIVLAGVVAQAWLGNRNYFGQVNVIGETQEIAQTILVCALVSGVAGGCFARMLLIAATGWKGRLAELRARRPYRFAALCGLLVAGLGWSSGGLTWCSGYDETRALLEGGETLPWYFGPAKFAATIASYLSGLPGGIFAPSLAIGAGLGQDLVPLLWQNAYPTTIIILCMVGFLAAVTQAPITSFIIVMEMVDGYNLVIAMMAAALLASGVSRAISKPLYATLAQAMIDRQRIAAASAAPPGNAP
jgi:H+/Cl- antiporter ClcA